MNNEAKNSKSSASKRTVKSVKVARQTQNLRLNPQLRLCPRFDEKSIADYPVAHKDEMGFRVVDDCVQDNIK